jgi:hypothetical protein
MVVRIRHHSRMRESSTGKRTFAHSSLLANKTLIPLTLFFGLSTLSVSGCSGCFAPKSSTERAETTEQTAIPTQESPKSKAVLAETEIESATFSPAATMIQRDSVEDVADDKSQGSDVESPLQTSGSAPEFSGESASTSDADSTLKAVEVLRQKANRASSQNELGSAFRLASEAWEAARMHPKDARSRQAAEELAVELDSLAQKLNSKFSKEAANPSTRLIEK